MAKYERRLIGEFDNVVNILHADIMEGGLSMNLVDQSDFSSGGMQVAVRVYDKYFMRNSSRASLSVTVVGHEGEVIVSAIGAGGGQGVIFNFSLGAETEMVELVQHSLERMAR